MSHNAYSCDCTVIHEEVVADVRGAMPDAAVTDRVAVFFRVLGDPTRTRLLWALDRHEMCVCDLANVLGMTKSAVSHQLGTLRTANLVRFRREGKTVYYALADDHVQEMLRAGLEHVYE